MKLRRIPRWLRIGLLSLVATLILAAASFTTWAYTGGDPMPEALAALESNEQVEVSQDSFIVFTPKEVQPSTGLIIYPGGRVDASAYAPLAQAIAAQGHLVVIVPVPLRLAFFGINRGNLVIQQFPEVDRWSIAGHSLGGVAAAIYVERNPELIDGLVLWASFPSGSLAEQETLEVVSIFGTNDGLIATDEIEDSRSLLPSTAKFVAIEGGNHAQFGWYGPQDGDGLATITYEDQMDQIVAGTLQVLE